MEAFYVRTYHNDLADWLTRELEDLVHAELSQKQWERMEPPEEWGAMMKDAKDRLLKYPGEKGEGERAAWQQQLQRQGGVKCQLQLAEGLGKEVGDTLRNYEAAWAKAGGKATTRKEAQWLFCSFSLDPKGKEVAQFFEEVASCKPAAFVIGAPRGCKLGDMLLRLGSQGYQMRQEGQECSRLGHATLRTGVPSAGVAPVAGRVDGSCASDRTRDILV